MSETGWVRLYRCLLDKAIWKCCTPEQKCVLVTLLLLANHEPNQWIWNGEKFDLQEGQLITSLNSLSEKAGVTKQNVRSALAKLEKAEFLTNQSTQTGRLITIVNWGVYQPLVKEPNTLPNKEPTKSQQRANKEVTPNKNDNNDKNERNNNIYCVSFEEFWSVYPRKADKKRAYRVYQTRLKEGFSEEEILKAAQNYADECKKENRDKRYIKHPSTFLGPDTPFTEYIKGKNDGNNNKTNIQPEYTEEQLRAFMSLV